MLNETDFDHLKKNAFSVVSGIADTAEHDDDGDIVFTDGSATYLLVFQESDPGFIRFVLPNFMDVDSSAPETLGHAMRLNHENKLVKITFNDKGRASVSIEMLVNSVDYLDKPMVKRFIRAMDSAALEIYQRLKSESVPKAMLQ